MASQPVKPSAECKLTIEMFQKDGKKLTDLCSKCFRLGINCLVEDHPSERDMAAPVDTTLIKELLIEQSKKLHSMELRQHIMNEKLPQLTEVFISPSEYKKSKHKETFHELMLMLDFGRQNMVERVISFNGDIPETSTELDFNFQWRDHLEAESYEPLRVHLANNGIDVVNVSEGQGLPDGLLYYSELWTLKANTLIRSEDLEKLGSPVVFKYILRGRTDFVRRRSPDEPLGGRNNRYFIEIKRVSDYVEEDSLREAVLQLIGGNASNSFHSPPVVLTNLARSHHVLYISMIGDPCIELRYKLHVYKMATFGAAIAFVEEKTAQMISCTFHFARRPTPPSSPPKPVHSELDEDSVTDQFENAVLIEAEVEDKRGYV